MEITTNNIYSSLPSSQTANSQSSNDSFNTLLDSQSQDTTNNSTKKIFRVVAFIDKYTSFSSLSKTEEKIFREILSDDKITLEEMKSLNYEQIKKLGDFLNSAVYGSGVSTDKIPLVKDTDIRVGAMFTAVRMTYNEDFNKAIFETVQTIDEQMEMMDFFDKLSDKLGWNDRTCLIPERDVPELRKNSTNENWEILDYKKFIESIVKEYENLIKNPITSDEEIIRYQKLLNDYLLLGKNHDEIKNKAKYS